MARSFDQVLAEVTAKSDPQRQLVLSQISDLPTQQAADEAGLGAKKDQGMEDIMLSARRRGVANWGAPIAEQQKYLSSDYLPAVANLKNSYGARKGSLESALAGMGQNDYASANDIFNQDRTFEEQQRQFNEQQAFAKQQAAAQSAQSSSLSSLFGGSNPQQPPQAPDPYGQIDKNSANVAVKQLLASNNPANISKTIQAISKSAGFGNVYDKYKLELLNDLMKNSQYGPLLSKAVQAGMKVPTF